LTGASGNPSSAQTAAAEGSQPAPAKDHAENNENRPFDDQQSERHWREHYRTVPGIEPAATYEEYAAAFAFGREQRQCRGFTATTSVEFPAEEPRLAAEWQRRPDANKLAWERARPAVLAAWERVDESLVEGADAKPGSH
jgi:hypothetical protein